MIIEFEKSKDGYTLRDALHLPDDHKLSKAAIETMKQARFDEWYAIVTTPYENPNPELEPQPEEDNG